MFSILLDPKLIGVVALIAGCGTTAICLSSDKCITFSPWLKDVSVPVMDCQKGDKHYQIFLTRDKIIKNTGEGIKLQVIDATKQKITDLRGSENESQDTRGQRVQINRGGGSWRIYSLALWEEKPSIQLMLPTESGKDVVNSLITCTTLNLKIKNNRGFRSSLNENIADVKFLVDEESCSKSSGRKECGIKFKDTHNLEWNAGFNPKVVLCASS